MEFDVFLCHNSSDKEAVKKIGEQLRAAGLKPWLDEWEQRPGTLWQKALEEQIVTIGAAAIFVGPDGFGPWHDQVKDAFLRQFVERSCPVIPVILAECKDPPQLPIFLKAFKWVDFRLAEPPPLDQLFWGITGKKPDTVPPDAKEQPTLPLNNLPSGTLGDLFKGREDLLAELEKNLDPNTPTALVQAKTLSGLGGVGKTRLAIEYAYRKAAHFKAIFFVNADNEAELRRNFARLAERDLLDLNLDSGVAEAAIVKEVKVALRERLGWLLILDNVDSKEAQQALKQILPLQGGQVLITSRLQLWPAQVKQLQVDKLSPKKAQEYLLEATESRPHRADDKAAAAKLAENLDYLPLALELSAAYVRENHIAFSELVANWATEQERLLDWYDESITDYPRSLAGAWSRSFEQLKPRAQALLKVLAHLAPEPIPQAMLEEGEELLREAAGGEFDLPAALVDLQRYSLLKREQEGGQKTITLHRLVQAVARGRIAAEEKAVWAERAVRLVNDFAPVEAFDVRTWPIWNPLRPHATRVVKLAEDCGVSQPTSTLMNNLALLLLSKALYSEAEPLMHRSLEIAEASFGKEHPEVAIRLNNLAQLLQDTNRYAEAEPLMRRSLAIDEASFGKEHPDVARDLNNLAALLKATNRHAEAEPLMRRSLAIAEASFGKEHPRVAIHLNNLAHLLQATNRYTEAEPLMRRSLAIDEASFGKEHPNVARDLNNLAALLQDTDRLAEAEPLMRRSLAILGDEHPRTSTVRENLARLLAELEAAAD